MKLKLLLILAQLVLWSYYSEAAIKLAIGYSTINPRIAPLWIAQEAGTMDAASVDTILSKGLEQRGFTVFGDRIRLTYRSSVWISYRQGVHHRQAGDG